MAKSKLRYHVVMQFLNFKFDVVEEHTIASFITEQWAEEFRKSCTNQETYLRYIIRES